MSSSNSRWKLSAINAYQVPSSATMDGPLAHGWNPTPHPYAGHALVSVPCFSHMMQYHIAT
eukprot:12744611-Prorocentrum_lima.AAC.1